MPDPKHTSDVQSTLLFGLAGGALLAQRRDRRSGRFAAIVGLGLIGSAALRIARRSVLRSGDARRRVRLKTTLEIARPVPEVFAFCKNFEHFPHIIGSLRRVVDYEDGRSHWEAYSASGDTVEWDAVVTKYVPNAVIAWTSAVPSEVDTTGVIRFAATPEGGTRLTIELTYRPRRTGLGDALHALTMPRRESQLRGDLQRAAFYIESLPAPAIELPAAPATHSAA